MSPKTQGMEFAHGESGGMLRVNAGLPAAEALELSAYLSEGIQLLCERLFDSVNEGDETICLAELRSLSFLAETAGILSRSVYGAIRVGTTELAGGVQ